MKEDGVDFQFNATPMKFEKADGGKVKAHIKIRDGSVVEIVVDVLLVATGRAPNVENLQL